MPAGVSRLFEVKHGQGLGLNAKTAANASANVNPRGGFAFWLLVLTGNNFIQTESYYKLLLLQKEFSKIKIYVYIKKKIKKQINHWALCKTSPTLMFRDNFTALCSQPPPSRWMKNTSCLRCETLTALQDGSIAANVRLGSGRSFRGNGAAMMERCVCMLGGCWIISDRAGEGQWHLRYSAVSFSPSSLACTLFLFSCFLYFLFSASHLCWLYASS